jgi:DNA-binding NtrC family response regulator
VNELEWCDARSEPWTKMPEMDGISLLRIAHFTDTDLVSIVMTGHGTIDSAIEAMKAGALECHAPAIRHSDPRGY